MQAMTINEACQVMRIGKTKIYSLINANELPARKLGAKTIVFKKDVDAYLESLPSLTSIIKY